MNKHILLPRRSVQLAAAIAVLAGTFIAGTAHADGPPSSNGVISNPSLNSNKTLVQAQGVNVITTFMSKGSQTCDAKGQNCHSSFGSDDTMDYTTMQQNANSSSGTQSFSFQDDNNSTAVSAQTGTLAIACGDTTAHTVGGVAVKATSCEVNSSGDARVIMQACSAPSRGNPVTPPPNAVPCSSDPTASNYLPPQGKVCMRPTCDTEQVDSLNGWSSPVTLVYHASLPANATTQDQTNNGLALSFYPPISGSVTDFTVDSDNMTALKVVETAVNEQTHQTAVGLKVAYRYKTAITKQMMTQGLSAVPNPGQHTDAWDSVQKLQTNPLVAQYGAKDTSNGTDCMNQLQSGVATDGKISVCDPNYSNESGIRPIARTAQVAAEGQNCGTTPQCLQQVVNTNTWTELCEADVPLSIRSCETKTSYTLNDLSYTRTRKQEVCHEQRTTAQYGCLTQGGVGTPGCQPGQPCVQVQTCQPGVAYTVIQNNTSGMGSDGCDGGDYITAQWTCPSDPSQVPLMTLSTNSKPLGTVSATLANGQSAVTYIGTQSTACYGKFVANTACTDGQCQGQYELHIGTMVCPVAQNCTSYSCGKDGMNTCQTCTCPVDTVFQEQSFGSASSIIVGANFSMSQAFSVNVSDQCSGYEAAQ
ncbi:hypothetical protein [Burkholderia ambifaria]|uniref:hypothetical protein n=1 Tax=Burkholderia ambifaria TaxID=152480 RepID=UPI000F814B6D|nr:hypothetical protein [Burkholderia ambifaria]